MAEESTRAYYAKRERQKRELAASANDASIKSIHQDLAERYAEKVARADDRSRTKLSIAHSA